MSHINRASLNYFTCLPRRLSHIHTYFPGSQPLHLCGPDQQNPTLQTYLILKPTMAATTHADGPPQIETEDAILPHLHDLMALIPPRATPTQT